MSRDLLIGVDAGTSLIKAVAFDLAGRQVRVASRRNTYDVLPGGGCEQDMHRTWRDTVEVLAELVRAVPDLATRAVALGVTGQGDGTWLVDADGVPVHGGWLWTDARARPQVAALSGTPQEGVIYEATATGLNLSQMRSQMMWMRDNNPDLLARAATALHCKDWLYLQMTGERATDIGEGIFTFGDFRTRTYSEAAIEAMGLRAQRHLLPPMVDGAAVSMPLLADVADQTGLPKGLPVSLAAVDFMCSALGAGLYDPTTRPGLTILGSTGVHMRFVPDAMGVQLNPDRSGYVIPFPGAAFAQLQTNMSATMNIDWMLGLMVQLLGSAGVERTPADLIEGLDARILAARPGAALFHPYILSAGERGPFVDPQARASFTGLDQGVDWFDMMRAVYDGLVLATRDCYCAMGPIPDEIRITGGAARSEAIKTLLAAALNRPVRTVAQPEAGAAGAAMIAATAQGVFEDIAAAAQNWVSPLLLPPVHPDAGLATTYDRLFDGYLDTRRNLPPIWKTQAALREDMK